MSCAIRFRRVSIRQGNSLRWSARCVSSTASAALRSRRLLTSSSRMALSSSGAARARSSRAWLVRMSTISAWPTSSQVSRRSSKGMRLRRRSCALTSSIRRQRSRKSSTSRRMTLSTISCACVRWTAIPSSSSIRTCQSS